MEGMSSQPAGTVEPVSPTLSAWLAERLGEDGPFELTYLSGGNSNETLLLRTPSRTAILRRPPQATLSPSAHSMEREFRVLSAVADTDVPAPKPLALAGADDEGGPFLVMECVDGFPILDDLPPAYPPGLDSLRAVGLATMEALARLHSVDWRAAGLEGFGKPTGYLERQLRRFTGLWEHNATREIAALDDVTRWLGEHIPESGPATVVHGDYRLGNVMFTGDRLSAIFDWELATIGDPLADIGYLLATYAEPGDPDSTVASLTTVTRTTPGFPTRDALVARYEERSGRSMTDVAWYTTLALWKSAIFLEGSYKRRLAGTTDDPFFDRLKDGVPEIAARARHTAFRSE